MARSMHESIHIKADSDDELNEGPFSRQNRFFDNRRLVAPGSREEFATFAAETEQNAAVRLSLEVPSLNVHLPNHRFLELVYNR